MQVGVGDGVGTAVVDDQRVIDRAAADRAAEAGGNEDRVVGDSAAVQRAERAAAAFVVGDVVREDAVDDARRLRSVDAAAAIVFKAAVHGVGGAAGDGEALERAGRQVDAAHGVRAAAVRVQAAGTDDKGVVRSVERRDRDGVGDGQTVGERAFGHDRETGVIGTRRDAHGIAVQRARGGGLQGLERQFGFQPAVGVVAGRSIHIEPVLEDGAHDDGGITAEGVGVDRQVGVGAGNRLAVDLEVAEGAAGPRRGGETEVSG